MTANTIYGTVSDPQGDPVTGVRVFITNPPGVFPDYEYTGDQNDGFVDAQGNYSILAALYIGTIYRDETGFHRSTVPIQFEVRAADGTVLAIHVEPSIYWTEIQVGRRVDLTAEAPSQDEDPTIPSIDPECPDAGCEGYRIRGLIRDGQ